VYTYYTKAVQYTVAKKKGIHYHPYLNFKGVTFCTCRKNHRRPLLTFHLPVWSLQTHNNFNVSPTSGLQNQYHDTYISKGKR